MNLPSVHSRVFFSKTTSMTGETISHYEILEKPGSAEWVWFTKLRTRGSTVSSPSNCFHPKRWPIRTASAASALNHPNIVTIHEIDELNDVDFIVMELVEGCAAVGPSCFRSTKAPLSVTFRSAEQGPAGPDHSVGEGRQPFHGLPPNPQG